PGLSSLRMGKRLREGMVITVEPGIYFIPALIEKWEREGLGGGFIDFAKVREYLDFGGIRIEDDMLITSFGNRLLGGNRPPVTTAQIEEYMND
ncbi:M24 family metallopeptidase, partial [Alistipes ihumii]